ncbi:MAG: glucose-6-phosphate dehydrogenase assembly protein OpcA [Chloroflexi bacterium]|nr:glucose-6-phosphate dehydrogenase assembly protein OpcA [Chloroflexota bacterium]
MTIDGASGLAPGLDAPVLRWFSRTRTIAGIEAELAKIWATVPLTTPGRAGEPERHVAARTSVMNLVVIARRPELGEHASSVIRTLTGRHPSRTLVLSSVDPDGPSWLDADIEAHCVLPRADAAETCAEFIYLRVGGESGRHLAAIVAPLIVHDLPVVLWWPGDPPLGTKQAVDLLEMSDRLVVDGSAWSGDGLDRLAALASIVTDRNLGAGHVAVSDFAMLRQSRWREAIASTFDRPELRPYLGGLRSITVRYAVHEGAVAGATNLIKPLYHVAWLASRLDLAVAEPFRIAEPLAAAAADGTTDALGLPPVLRGALRAPRRRIPIELVPVISPMHAGTTLAVELQARRRAGELAMAVTAEADAVMVRATLHGRRLPERRFMAPRRTEVELLAETVESVGRDPVAVGALLAAATLVAPA